MECARKPKSRKTVCGLTPAALKIMDEKIAGHSGQDISARRQEHMSANYLCNLGKHVVSQQLEKAEVLQKKVRDLH